MSRKVPRGLVTPALLRPAARADARRHLKVRPEPPGTPGARIGAPRPRRPRADGLPISETVSAVLDLIAASTRLALRARARSSRLHVGSGVSGVNRAVLRDVIERGPSTVPELARARASSRQQVQVIVDHLESAGLVRRSAKPSNRRSSIVTATASGKRLARELVRREAASLGGLDLGLTEPEITAATRVLERVRRTLEAGD